MVRLAFSTIVALLLLGGCAVVIYDSVRLGFNWTEGEGPAPGYFPFYVAMILGVSSLVNLLSALRGHGAGEIFVSARPFSRVLAVLLPSLVYVALLAGKLPLDWGPIGASYLGTLGIGAMFLAIGVFTSAVTRNQVVAAVFSFALTFLAFLPAFLEFLVNDPKMRDALGYLNLYQHMDDFSKGIVDTRRLVYYLSVTAFFLFLASRAVEAGKGK